MALNRERELVINPVVQDSIQHNARTLTNIYSLTSSLLGITAGTLRLESTIGFLFFFVSTLTVSALIFAGPAKAQPERFFYSQFKDLWTGDIFGGLMSYILTWTLVYNLVGT